MSLEMSSNDADQMSVSEFFNGQSILITGATGFMGKVLVQKLLKRCPGVSKIFLLIRPKRNVLPESRLADLFRAPIFSDLTKADFEKVVAVAGDITLPALGISKEDEEMLIKEVSVVFHSAATVKFDDELTKSVQMNLEGTRQIVELSRRMANLKAFVHASTAYSHCYLESIEEKFYPCESASPDAVADICRAAESSETLKKALNHPVLVKEVIGLHPNTYTYSKALAEQWLLESAQDLPLAIVRPSIVVAAWKDPLPGWVDNLNGPTGMITGAASGILRSIIVDPDCRADIIPVDVVINLMCVVAAKLGNKSIGQESIPIYNCTSGSLNPITWSEIRNLLIEGVKKYPLEKMLWFPGLSYHANEWSHMICHVLMHKIPAVLVDILVQLAGHRPFMKKIVQRMEKASGALKFFATRQWSWNSHNMVELEKTLSPEDKETFEIDITKLDWNEFMLWYAYGSRHYVMKYDPSTVEATKKKAKVLHRAHQALVFFMAFALISFICMLLPFEIPGQFVLTSILSFGVVMSLVMRKID